MTTSVRLIKQQLKSPLVRISYCGYLAHRRRYSSGFRCQAACRYAAKQTDTK